MRLRLALVAASIALVFSAGDRGAGAQTVGVCRTLEVSMTPSEDLQIVVWVEDAAGNYVDTIFITRTTGSYGLGNRPGIMEFNSGPLWPYGRRITTFPVWAHRHGHTFPLVTFQNGDETNLSHPIGQSSLSRNYCRPLRADEAMWDAMSCATTAYTDKGLLSDSEVSLYPPRSDLSSVFDPARDHSSVEQMAQMNPFDVVSKATPLGGELYTLRWAMPPEVPNGDYVVVAEVSREFDPLVGSCQLTVDCEADPGQPDCACTNMGARARRSCGDVVSDTCEFSCVDEGSGEGACYYAEPFPIPWAEYGLPYRGQPSVIYQTPITVMNDGAVAATLDYAGYGDPHGLDGMLRAPDASIATGVPGSGASRLQLTVDGSDMYRLQTRALIELDEIPPGAPSELQSLEIAHNQVTASFIAPGDDDTEGTVAEYDVRYLAGVELSEDNWDQAIRTSVQVAPAEAGSVQSFTIDGLIPRTNYYIGVRAFDNCLNQGALEVFKVTTPPAPSGEVDACFVATAAHGSKMAADVTLLRAFRDKALRGHVPGELLVAGYYTFGPALAKVIEPSATARGAARSLLAPVVAAARRALRDR